MRGVPVFNYSVKNDSGNSSLDIYIDSDIVDPQTQEFYKLFFGDDTTTSYKSFRDLVNKSDAKTVNVYINSPGGQVTEAMAIHDMLVDMRNNGKKVNTIGRGIVASSASYILMAGDEPSMSSNSWLMIHNVSGFVAGDVNTIENYARTTRKFNDKSNEFYQKATGLSKTVIGNMMDQETWMTAEEAKQKGFIKVITGEAQFKQAIPKEQWMFTNNAVLNSYNSFIQKTDPIMDTSKITEAINNGFKSLMDKLGVTSKKDDKEVKEAFDNFSKTITDAIAAGSGTAQMDEAKVTSIVAKALETVPKNITDAIEAATKGLVKAEALSGLLSQADFTKQMDELKKDLIQKLGTSGAGEDGNGGNGGGDGKGKKKLDSRYAYANLWPSGSKN